MKSSKGWKDNMKTSGGRGGNVKKSIQRGQSTMNRPTSRTGEDLMKFI